MTGGLRGHRVLIPRGGAWGSRVRDEIVRRGGEAVIAPLIESRPPRDTDARDAAFARLAAGNYAWVFITSAATVEQLVARGATIPIGTRIAAVGRPTARAVADAGFEVEFVPVGTSSATNMIAQWCAGRSPRSTGRCLVLRSDLAMAVISDELELQGYDVDVCIAYRTVGVDLDPIVAADIRTGAIDTVLLTSLSVGRELRRQVGIPGDGVFIASIGPGTTRDAQKLGFTVHHTAHSQSVDALIAELDARPATEESP
ncbi:uroporphyrinogen-III synthase [Microbacterium radiodurans]|uniref:Uroporphyrinogen-III synthase n=1 Tax=Microbacterium radiodurans TaxID=661398 RepID=A0A5J5IQI3_9MICO|nr:uroporphyrinogen-III synthase [Microbacterium radiodurans]KAA9086580.1 uroporphyrinogen-III synthase [Microbacterium radiodurans]